ncbi:hypothetical protein ACNTMW_04055 [Planosporangium sp. 12N6]|uniref:hypothetical protein n=1 Tax=Planosporangium spinosum TaxID=3402278 RepID=UPI003CE9DD6B
MRIHPDPADGGAHASPELLERYVTGDARVDPDVVWALEVHLESCPECRQRLATTLHRRDSAATALLERVRAGVDARVAGDAAHAGTTGRDRRHRPVRTRALRWATPAVAPWLATTVLVVLTAVGFDLVTADEGGRTPSLVLLLAPVLPLLGVAAAWRPGLDPAHELVAATPRAGLYLVFRRTLAVLAVVMPVLVVAGLAVGTSPARWLLPCLAFTTGALALGEIVGLARAAAGLAIGWAAVVVLPSLATARPPAVLDTTSLPAWAALTAVTSVLLIIRRDAYTRLPGGR